MIAQRATMCRAASAVIAQAMLACSSASTTPHALDAAVIARPDAAMSSTAVAGAATAPPTPMQTPAAQAGASGSAVGRAGASGTSTFDASVLLDAQASTDAMTTAASDAGMAMATDAGAPATIAQPHELHGVNWADERDNFVQGTLQLSGLDASADTYASVQTKTSQIIAEFQEQLGANTIRIPINEPTVSSAWWDSYKAVIDTTTAMNMNVIVAYWAYHNGKPDDEAAFKTMWQKVVTAYADNARVFFDIHNEPSGFSASAWKDEAARWLGYFPSLPRARIIVAGTGSDDDLAAVGSDKRFDGCMLQLHYYAFWHKDWTTQKQWRDAVSAALGDYAERTIVGEWGAAMSTGLDYDTKTPDGNSEIAYITAMADLIRERNMGSVYWPGLRDDDSYALLKRSTNAGAITLSVVNASGRDRLRWSWDL